MARLVDFLATTLAMRYQTSGTFWKVKALFSIPQAGFPSALFSEQGWHGIRLQLMGSSPRSTLAEGNQGTKFLQRNTEKTGIRIRHTFDKIEKDVPIAPGIPDDMAFREGHRIAAGARDDVIQVLEQKRNLLLCQ
jgi:hypothetical protein